MTKSDHNLLICKFNIKIQKYKLQNNSNRIQNFNFNDPKGWEMYKNLTSGQVLTDCIKGINIEEESRIWMKKLKKYFISILSQIKKNTEK